MEPVLVPSPPVRPVPEAGAEPGIEATVAGELAPIALEQGVQRLLDEKMDTPGR